MQMIKNKHSKLKKFISMEYTVFWTAIFFKQPFKTQSTV